MNKFINYLKVRRVAFASTIVIFILYAVMIFAEFFAPYPATRSFAQDTFHPANVRITREGLVAQECRIIDPVTWSYARVRGRYHKVGFFIKGAEYRLLGFIPCSRHLFGTVPDESGETYPVFLLGADNLGRDLFSRIVMGSRISLTIGFVASAISLVLAVLLGGLAGFYGGGADWGVMRLAEFFMLIPSLYLILFLRSLLNTQMDSGQAYMMITLILSLVGWPGSARTIRGMVHAIKREEFIMDADLEGIPSTVIIFRHIIPQMASLLIVSVALSVPSFIMSETTLSYLGLGIADPAVSWGSLINRDISTLNNLRNYPWLLWPVLLLLLVTLAFNFLGDALRDYFDPYHAVFRARKRPFGKNKTPRGKNNNFTTSDETRAKINNFVSVDEARSKINNFSTAGEAHETQSAAQSPSAQNSDARTFLSVEHLSVTFTTFRGAEKLQIYAVRDVSFFMRKGEVLGIVGESGSGKSVSTTAIPGLLPQNALVTGSVYFEGTDLVNAAGIRNYRGKKIGMIFQEPGRSFDPLQNIGSVFFEAFRAIDKTITKDEAYKKAAALLNEVGLPDTAGRLSNFPHQFSGGQLQRIGIALSIAQGCELLIADEPTTSLDVTIQAQIVSLLMRLRRERHLSIIFISHDIALVSRISDRIIVMYGGKIMEQGSAKAIVKNARHPYTRALLAATPSFGSHYTKERMKSIPGKVGDPAHPEPGCPFAPRCEVALETCATPDSICPYLNNSAEAER